jgi:3D (Asp-Asp-Asp) domain-containing protein
MPRIALLPALCALILALSVSSAVAGGGNGGVAAGARPANGGVALITGGLVPRPHHGRIPPPPSRRDKGRWVKSVTITEYWPSPESWFAGRKVFAPGLLGLHRIDWLYSANGISMQGEGIGLDGRMYHIASLGSGGWVTSAGRDTSPADGWASGSPFWRAGAYWADRTGAVTFPLATGGWSSGPGRRYVELPGVTFAPGPSLPLHDDQSLAVDPKVIPLGSRVYVPAYRHDGHGGWFIAQDTGGAISGHHIDVFRHPPASSSDPGRLLTGARIYVIRPRS